MIKLETGLEDMATKLGNIKSILDKIFATVLDSG